MDIRWMAWTPVTAGFFTFIVLMLIGMTVWQIVSRASRAGVFCPSSPPGEIVCS